MFQRQIQPALQFVWEHFVLHRFGSKFIPDWSQSRCSSLMRPVLGLLHPYSSEYMLCILGGSSSCDTCDVLVSLIMYDSACMCLIAVFSYTQNRDHQAFFK